MALAPIAGVTAAVAADAYARIDRVSATTQPGSAGDGFGAALRGALEGAVRTGQTAENQAMAAIAGTASLTDVVTALARAELTLQTATTVRDRVIQAYQDIIRMPI
jgi:flagellar hook-basal body complex protein FliE